ncbi:hypothetical protein EYZ11_006676 [Aspergillus tanneri]|uniref:Uncharacterized protein n=1 Tax=Aspergillus tanneri TaxID=1220188 RepID=A0A4V3UP60_9EURO|nr:hypothetical protein EYZ11_006676 [Aspergillus tanneri]
MPNPKDPLITTVNIRLMGTPTVAVTPNERKDGANLANKE